MSLKTSSTLPAFTAGDSDPAWINNAGKRERKVEMHKPAGQLDEVCPSALPALLPEGRRQQGDSAQGLEATWPMLLLYTTFRALNPAL